MGVDLCGVDQDPMLYSYLLDPHIRRTGCPSGLTTFESEAQRLCLRPPISLAGLPTVLRSEVE